jgi:hypothetical protein
VREIFALLRNADASAKPPSRVEWSVTEDLSMNQRTNPLPRRATGWLLGLALLLTSVLAAAQQDPPARVGRLNFQQGTVSFSPPGDDNWYETIPNRPLITGDRLWADRSARAEVYVGSTAVRLDEQTSITMSEVDDNTARITATQGSVQVRLRDDLAGGRFEVDTANMAMVVDTPGDFRINVDPVAGTTQVAVASGNVTLYGENGESTPLGAHQQLTVAGRNLEVATGTPVRAGTDFDRWVAERDRIDDQSVSARYVSRDTVGYQQLDSYGDWQNDPNYGAVWYPRDVDTDWAPYQNGQWANVAPWGWTWIDAAPWGFAPTHYGRWARVGPRWCWVPGRPHARPVYSPALVAFVGGTAAGVNANLAIGGGRHGVGWFPLAPGEAWRPGYRASQRYVDEANRAAFDRRVAARNAEFVNRLTPGAVTVVPTDAFGRGPIARRDVVQVPTQRLAGVPVGMGAPIPLRGGPAQAAFSRSGAMPPPGAFQPRQPQQFQQALQVQQMQRQQQEMQQRAAGQAMQAQQAQQLQQAQRQQQEVQQRAAAQAVQAQQAQQLQQAQRQQQEVQQRAAAQGMQAQQMQQLQQAQRQQQEAQQRAAAQAMQSQQAQQLQQAQRQQQEVQQRAAAQAMQVQQAQQHLEAQRQQQEIQQRAAAQAMQAQQAQQLQQMQRQQVEAQQRAAQAQVMQMQQQQAMRAQQQQAQQQLHTQQQQAVRQAQEARPRGSGRPDQPQQGLVDRP